MSTYKHTEAFVPTVWLWNIESHVDKLLSFTEPESNKKNMY